MKHYMYSLDEEVLQELQNRTGRINLSVNQMIRRVLVLPQTYREHDAILRSVKNIYLTNPGITIKNIAQQLGISISHAHQLLSQLHLKPYNHALLRTQSVKEVYLANPGITSKEIAQQLHITVDRVYQIQKQLGLKPKNRRSTLDQSIKEIYFADPGITVEGISNQLQISTRSAYRKLERLGLKLHRHPKMQLLSTVQAVVQMRIDNPGATLQDIGDKIGVSKQRVHRILREHDLQTRHCSQKLLYECPVCGKISSHKFCSIECQKKWHQIIVECTNCGKLFTRSESELLGHYRNSLFCSRECFGKWISERYGFKAHPENCGRHKQWDYSLVSKTRLETGYGARRLSKLLNIPDGTINGILGKCKSNEDSAKITPHFNNGGTQKTTVNTI